MNRSFVLTIIGPDRPGVVEALSSVVADHDGNWVESRMSRLAGQFAGILRVMLPATNADAFERSALALESQDLRVQLASIDAEPESSPDRRVRLELTGQDRPGIVRQISAAVARHGVNVEELTTERGSAAMTGEEIFGVRAELRVPGSTSLDELRDELDRVASDLLVE
ncbi:MAG: ACT domain-containing protein, partial [Planctomycetota bacterium]